jgi:5-methylcytosine-specific restriction protein A
MNTFIFVWNPKIWDWYYIEDSIKQIEQSGKTEERWGCGNNKSIKPGDRVFLVKLGTNPKGIIASGYTTTAPYLTKHFKRDNKGMNCVSIDFEVLLNPDKEPILLLDILKTGNLAKQSSWTPQASGISISQDIVDELEAVWFDFLNTQQVRHNPFTHDETEKKFIEGALHQVTLSRYERNPFARKICLEHYGYSCSVCEFNFEKVYGDIGKEFIHVHHLTQLATIGKEYNVDPINDLRPVCPNCHAMLHRRKNGFSLEELKSFMGTENQSS